ncbi:hypothetical protein IKE88_02975 [Candidatus Saccharibacteria bacterium]|nr:hypothetical protein [Candidatus Saccharibacteria bacterium]
MSKKILSVLFVAISIILVLSLIFLPHRVKAATVINIYPEQLLQRNRDVNSLACLIETEAGSDFIPFDDKVKVGLTVLHRCDNPAFPGTVEENINKPGQYAEPSTVASEQSVLAAERAMYLWQSGTSYQILPSEALYFSGDGKRNYFRDAQGNIYDEAVGLSI